MKKGATAIIGTYKHQLAICSNPIDNYEPMKYYPAIYSGDVLQQYRDSIDGMEYGYFVRSSLCRYDFFPEDEFKQYFTIVENCDGNKKVSGLLYWLRSVRSIKITICPDVKEDGYWYEYSFWTSYPFYVTNVEEHGFGSFELAAKRAINLAKEACLKTHGIKGIKEWVNYTFNKK